MNKTKQGVFILESLIMATLPNLLPGGQMFLLNRTSTRTVHSISALGYQQDTTEGDGFVTFHAQAKIFIIDVIKHELQIFQFSFGLAKRCFRDTFIIYGIHP